MIWLASASPRRHQLLAALGLDAQVVVSGVDEDALRTDTASGFVAVAAAAKADAVASRVDANDVVLGCDTVVVHDGVALGKPRDRAGAEQVLRVLAGERVTILSGLRVREGDRVEDRVVASWCRMAKLDESNLIRYLDTEVWVDKAGSLAVQADEPSIIDGVDGCYSNALGLPVCVLVEILAEFGVATVDAPPCHVDRSTPCAVRL